MNKKKEQLPFYEIFGQKHRKKKHPKVNEQQIEQLLQEKVPFLQGGNIINIASSSYRNGIMLKIDYFTPSDN